MNAWKRLDERLSAGKGRTLWQFVKFNLVSLTVTILQLLLANLLPLAFDRVVSPLPPLLRGNLRLRQIVRLIHASDFQHELDVVSRLSCRHCQLVCNHGIILFHPV